jgi:hypothetical protein
MMEVARTSETLVNFYQTTRRCNPEDSHLHTRRCENLKSYFLGRSPTEATRLRFDQEKRSLYSRLLVECSVRNGASPTSATTMG